MWTTRLRLLVASLIMLTGIWLAQLALPETDHDHEFDSVVNQTHKAMVWDVNVVTQFFESRVPTDTANLYARLVVKYAYAKDIPPALIAGVIMQESGVKYDAVSVAGARGLMQIIPSWWNGVYPECGEDFFHAETNICYGTAILRFFLDEEGGNRRKALDRYSGQAKDYYNRVFAYVGTVCTL